MLRRKPVERIKPKELLRLEAFSDAVFAIAITLLILEMVQALHYDDELPLFRTLLINWKYFVAFAIGFLTILICWINHHFVVSYVEKTDSKLFWFNGFVLLVVTFTPFPTAILAEYLEREPHHAMAVFGFNYVMMSIAAYCISAYTWHKVVKKSETNVLYYCTLMYKYSIIYTIIAFLVCFVSVTAAVFMYIMLFVVFAFPHEFSMKLLRWKTGNARTR
jgi:uncharacterized membrane protein